MSCVSFLSAPSNQMRNTLSTQRLTFVPSASGSRGFTTRWSRPSLRPSFVMASMLSSLGSTILAWTFVARSESSCTSFFCISVGCETSLWYTTSGVGRFSWSAVLMSATSRNRFISSGRLKNLENLVRAR